MAKPIRVLCVFSSLDRGGAENMCMNLYRNIDRNKVQFDFIKHTSATGAFESEITSLGGRIYAAPRYKLINHSQYIAWWRSFLRTHPEYQIVHGHFFTISAVYFRIAKQCGRTTVGHVHASGMENPIKALLCKRIEKYADHCFACSSEAGKWLYPHKEFKVIPNALDVSRFTFNEEMRLRQRELLDIKENTLVLGAVAKLSAVKNPNGLIDIVLALKKRCPDVLLLWIGDGSNRQEVESRIRDEQLGDTIKLLGVRSDVPSLLMTMDCFLLPSFNEGLPVSLVEAQTAGLMCYCSDTITREADVTSRCRFLPLGDWETWADHILADDLTHRDVSDSVRKAGYDIRDTSAWLTNFYLNCRR